MKKVMIGLVAAAGIALATPALSQVYFGAGPGGVGAGVGGPGYYDGAMTAGMVRGIIGTRPMATTAATADAAPA
jgi:hypothetical protein